MATVFTDMELDDESQEELAAPMLAPTDKAMLPKYPWGLRISLTEKELAKLDLDPAEAFVDGMIHLHALARITSVSCDKRQNGDECHRIELQIEQLAVESEDAENEENERAEDANTGRGSVLYKKG